MKIGLFSVTRSEVALVSTDARKEQFINFKSLEGKGRKTANRKVKRIKKTSEGIQRRLNTHNRHCNFLFYLY